jgi:hypothetical protein
VPDWATAEKCYGWELDTYSRRAWDQAMHEFNSEWTPMQFTGERMEPNILNWFRMEQWGKGNSSRLFYNEVPKPFWHRYGGHFDNPEKNIYSFLHGDQEPDFKIMGINTTTPEGREEYKKEWQTACQIVPELISKEDMVYPHEQTWINDDPHFQRIW